MSYQIKSNIIKSIDGKIKYKQLNEGGRKHFHLGLWLEASERELDEVECVEYQLHPSFRKQNRNSRNRPNNFSITFWTWGIFNIKVTITLHSGETKTMDYYLEYSLPSERGDYVKV